MNEPCCPRCEEQYRELLERREDRIDELEKALRDTRNEITPCPMDEHCESSYLCRGDTCPYCQKFAIETIDAALRTTGPSE